MQPKGNNFDIGHELEDAMFEDNPLNGSRKKGSRFDLKKLPDGPDGKLAQDLMKLETKFRVIIIFLQ